MGTKQPIPSLGILKRRARTNLRTYAAPISHFFFTFLCQSAKTSYFCSDFDSPNAGMRVKILLEKDVTNVIFGVQISQICYHLEETQQERPLWVYCTLFTSILLEQPLQYHATWAIELLILGEGNARAWTRDKRVEHPRLSYLHVSSLNRGGYRHKR